MTCEPVSVELDIRGQICPSTLLTALKQVNSRKDELRSGGCILVILTDNRHSTTTISEAVGNMGYQVEVADCDSSYRITITGTL